MAEKRKIMVEMTLEELLAFQAFLKNPNTLKSASMTELVFELIGRIPSQDKKRTFNTNHAEKRGVAIEEACVALNENSEFEYKFITMEKK